MNESPPGVTRGDCLQCGQPSDCSSQAVNEKQAAGIDCYFSYA